MSVDETSQSEYTEWQTMWKNESLHYVAYKRPSLEQRTHRLKGDGRRFHANGNDKVGITIYMSDKTYLKGHKKDKEGHYIKIKGSIQEKNFILINIDAIMLQHSNT